jgi:2-dehydropantoate 2-reductase
MGTVLGAFLARRGLDVDLIDTYAAHVNAMRDKGARVIGMVDMTVPVKAILPDEMRGKYDLVFLLTKQTANAAALPLLDRFLAAGSTVCTLQNGVPEPAVAGRLGAARTVGGTVLWGATFREPGVSELTQNILSNGDHLFEIGEINGIIGKRIRAVAAVLEAMGPVRISARLMDSRWGKLVNNACMSGMSAVCGCTFGEVLDNPRARACLSYLGREVKRCCEKMGYTLPVLLGGHLPDSLDIADQAMFDENQRMFLDMYEGLRTAKASMLQDLEKNNPTEVSLINGFVCATGEAQGVATPFNDLVVRIVTGIEEGRFPLGMGNLERFNPALFLYRDYAGKP